MKNVATHLTRLKSLPFGKVVIQGTWKQVNFQLTLLTASCVQNPRIIALLSRWRKKNEVWFRAQFPVTRKRTGIWLKDQVIDVPRLLFLLSVKGTYIGHLGFFRFTPDGRSCEIDNVVRGRREYPGVMGAAVLALMSWGKKKLGMRSYTLQTTSDNVRALALYSRLGFAETKRIPLVYKKTKGGGAWEEKPKGYRKPIRRYDIFMKQK